MKYIQLYVKRTVSIAARSILAALACNVTCAISSFPSAAASVTAEAWPIRHEKVSDVATEALVTRLLDEMTLEEKVGQMIQADIASISPQELLTYKLGSILAGGNAAPDNNPRTAPSAWLKLTEAYYESSLQAASSTHPPIPILFGIDAVHGNAKIIGATIFPHNVGLGAARDPELLRQIGAITAREVAILGIDWTFAPTVAVARDVRWGRSYESYSEIPALVAEYAPAMVEGLQGKRNTAQFMAPGHTLASVKHFVGDGGTAGGRDQGDTIASQSQLSQIHAAGYAPALDAGALIVMASYNSWNGVKMHANRHLLTEVLKGRLGFQGFVVGDWNAHEQIPGCTKTQCASAILAGVDMLMAPDGWKEMYENTLIQARSGVLPMQRIDDAVRRILRVKTLAGMFKRLPPVQRPDAGKYLELGSAAHRAVARRAVQESLVLLKNARGVLPLNPRSSILVCGDFADDLGAQAGGWTVDWQGDRNSNEDFPGSTTILAGIEHATAAAGGSVSFDRDGTFTKRPDNAVVVFGEGPYAEFQGDRENLEFSPHDKHELALLHRLQAQGIPTVSVFLSGRPMWVNPELNASDAFVAAWLPGSEGEGVSDVLFGAVPFTGRLGFSWPATAMPVTFNGDGSVSGALYPTGFGLAAKDVRVASSLSEDPHILEQWQSPEDSLFRSAHVTAPWSIFLADAGAQVHMTTAHQPSPHGAVSAQISTAGVNAKWAGTQPGMFEISGRAQDLNHAAARGDKLIFKYKVEVQPDQAVNLSMLCTEPKCDSPTGATVSLTEPLRHSPRGEWHTLSIPLICFTSAGANLDAVEMPLVLDTAGHLQLTIASASLAKASVSESPSCPRIRIDDQ